MAPFKDTWSREHRQGRRELEQKIFDYSDDPPTVFVVKAVGLRAELRALAMSDLERADLEDALAICTDPEREQRLLDEMWHEASLLRARHRRVRDAVNHGVPLNLTTLNSVRNYADATSGTALNIALSWFKNGGPEASLIR